MSGETRCRGGLHSSLKVEKLAKLDPHCWDVNLETFDTHPLEIVMKINPVSIR